MNWSPAFADRHTFVRAPSIVWAHVRLARVPDTSLAFLGTIVSAGLAGMIDIAPVAVLAVAASTAFLSGASMMINDWHDVEEDRINCPDRPIPSGEVPADRALAMAVAAFAVGVALAALAGPGFAIRALVVVALSVAYTWRLKGVPLAGHLLTASLSSYPLWCWAFDGSRSPAFWALSAGYLVGTVGKEIVRTAADVQGDAAVGTRTLATMFGAAAANRIGAAIIGVAMLIASIPALQRETGAAYSMVAVLSLLAIVPGCLQIARDPRSRITSGRLITTARTITVLMALALMWDLVAQRAM